MVCIEDRAKSIFLDALEIKSDAERAVYAEAQCGNDDELRREVRVLLDHANRLGGFLNSISEGNQPTVDRTPAEQPGTQIGRYKLLEQVGEGGMGVVYVAEQTEPVRRRVALKIIKPGMDTKQVIARFEAERQALAMMDHPNIARVLDAGTTDAGRPYFVMELVRGMPITEYCDKAKLSPKQRLELFIDVCQAVQHAHQKGIIHRDLKPSNVMVTMQDGRPVVKVIDFGVAKAVGQQLTERTVYTALTQLVGTPLYMSPEQAELTNHDVDTRSDVYSLGVLLYELLTGQTPFDKEALSKAGFDEMRRMIREDEPPRPSRRFSTLGAAAISTASQHRGLDERQLNRLLSGELDWIVMKALEKDRGRRYESASALAIDIQRYLSDEPVLACPPTTMYRFQKFARKHKPALFTAASVALCLLLGTTVSAWQAVRATTAEGQATANEQRADTERNQAQKERNEVEAVNEKLRASNAQLQATQSQLRNTLYASHMNLAQHAWDAHDIGRLDELLVQHRPKAGESDLRGFEWHYLYRLYHSDLFTVKGHSGSIPGARSVAFSPDGKHLAFTSGSHTDRNKLAGEVKVLDAKTGQELLVCKGHTDVISSVVYRPDGERLASSSNDETIKVWDAHTGQELITCRGLTGNPRAVAYSPDGKRLAAAALISSDSPDAERIKVWDAETGKELLSLKGTGSSVEFSPDGRRLASGGQDYNVKVWDSESGRELLTLNLAGWMATFSPDGKRLATGGNGVSVWDSATGRKLLSFQEGVRQVNSVAFSHDGKRLVSAANDGTVKVWDSETGKQLSAYLGHGGMVSSAVFSHDGTRLASGNFNGTVKVWDATTSSEARSFAFGLPKGRLGKIVFSPDGRRIAYGSGTWDEVKKDYIAGVVNVLDAQTGKELVTFKGHTELVWSVAFSPDGKRLASGSGKNLAKAKTGELRVWDAETGKELFTCSGHTAAVVSVAFSPDGKRLASSSSHPNSVGVFGDEGEPGEVIVWDAQTGQRLLSLVGHKRFVNSVAFSPDGKRIATLGRDNTRVWDSQTGQELLTINVPHRTSGTAAFSPDGKRLASSSGVWDAETGHEICRPRINVNTSVVFTPDGKRLIAGGKVWDAQTGMELITLGGGNVALSPDGHRLASAQAEGIIIYDATPLPEKP